jgi:hypothetical protein
VFWKLIGNVKEYETEIQYKIKWGGGSLLLLLLANNCGTPNLMKKFNI